MDLDFAGSLRFCLALHRNDDYVEGRSLFDSFHNETDPSLKLLKSACSLCSPVTLMAKCGDFEEFKRSVFILNKFVKRVFQRDLHMQILRESSQLVRYLAHIMFYNSYRTACKLVSGSVGKRVKVTADVLIALAFVKGLFSEDCRLKDSKGNPRGDPLLLPFLYPIKANFELVRSSVARSLNCTVECDYVPIEWLFASLPQASTILPSPPPAGLLELNPELSRISGFGRRTLGPFLPRLYFDVKPNSLYSTVVAEAMLDGSLYNKGFMNGLMFNPTYKYSYNLPNFESEQLKILQSRHIGIPDSSTKVKKTRSREPERKSKINIAPKNEVIYLNESVAPIPLSAARKDISYIYISGIRYTEDHPVAQKFLETFSSQSSDIRRKKAKDDDVKASLPREFAEALRDLESRNTSVNIRVSSLRGDESFISMNYEKTPVSSFFESCKRSPRILVTIVSPRSHLSFTVVVRVLIDTKFIIRAFNRIRELITNGYALPVASFQEVLVMYCSALINKFDSFESSSYYHDAVRDPLEPYIPQMNHWFLAETTGHLIAHEGKPSLKEQLQDMCRSFGRLKSLPTLANALPAFVKSMNVGRNLIKLFEKEQYFSVLSGRILAQEIEFRHPRDKAGLGYAGGKSRLVFVGTALSPVDIGTRFLQLLSPSVCATQTSNIIDEAIAIAIKKASLFNLSIEDYLKCLLDEWFFLVCDQIKVSRFEYKKRKRVDVFENVPPNHDSVWF